MRPDMVLIKQGYKENWLSWPHLEPSFFPINLLIKYYNSSDWLIRLNF